MSEDYGLETLYELERSRIKSQMDVLVVVIHWRLTSPTTGLRCIGSGDSQTSGEPSELLPAGWNTEGTVYSLKYQDTAREQQYILKVLSVEDTAVVSLLRTSDQKSTDLTLDPATYISPPTDFCGTLGRRADLLCRLNSELIGPLLPQQDTKKEKEEEERRRREQAARRREQEQEEDNDPLRIRPSRPGVDPRMPDWGGRPAPPIGSSDLDPLGRIGGGGMLMDPRGGRHRDIEPRWDPVGPMGPMGPPPLGPGRSGGRGGGRGGPLGGGSGSNWGDEMPPPGWDMYM